MLEHELVTRDNRRVKCMGGEHSVLLSQAFRVTLGPAFELYVCPDCYRREGPVNLEIKYRAGLDKVLRIQR